MTANAAEVLRVLMPLLASANARTAINTCTNQSTTIKQCPAYGTTQPVQVTVADMDTAIGALKTTCDRVDNLEAELSALKKTRGVQLAALRLKHDNVATALNNASNNDPQAAQAWLGKTKTRAKPAPVTATTAPPAGGLLECLKTRHGTVKAMCTPEPGAVSYLYQTGGDPAHPENWAPPTICGGHTFKIENLPIGQLFYLRIAIVRRGNVQSQYTPVLQVMVK